LSLSRLWICFRRCQFLTLNSVAVAYITCLDCVNIRSGLSCGSFLIFQSGCFAVNLLNFSAAYAGTGWRAISFLMGVPRCVSSWIPRPSREPSRSSSNTQYPLLSSILSNICAVCRRAQESRPMIL
jgi:hypothetical protein